MQNHYPPSLPFPPPYFKSILQFSHYGGISNSNKMFSSSPIKPNFRGSIPHYNEGEEVISFKNIE